MPRHFGHQPGDGSAFNIGRVAQDQIKPAEERRRPIPGQEAGPIGQAEPARIARGKGRSIGAAIHPNATRGLVFTKHSQQKRARAGAKIKDTERPPLIRAGFQRRFNEAFGIRAGDQRGG